MAQRLSGKNVVVVLDEFAHRQFNNPSFAGTVIPISMIDFMAIVHKFLSEEDPELHEGYAPFCKHIFMPCANRINGVKVTAIAITEENKHMLESDYKARTPEELPVLTRWFPRGKVEVPDATYLDLILYSCEQVVKESIAMKRPPPTPNFDWAIISVKGQSVNYELPMDPITVMRNALGREEGGSGVAIDRKKYLESVEYWKNHANLV